MEKIQIVRKDWTNKEDKKLSVSAGKDLDLIKEQVRKGKAELWKCTGKNKKAYIVTKLDVNELVIVLFEGSGIDDFLPFFINRAIELNLTIRAHVKRKAFLRIGRKHGFKLAEYIIRFNHG